MARTYGIGAAGMAALIGLAWVPWVANKVGGLVDKIASALHMTSGGIAGSSITTAGTQVYQEGKAVYDAQGALKND